MAFPWKPNPAASDARSRTSQRRRRVRRALGLFVVVVAICIGLDARAFNYFEQYAGYSRQGVYERYNPSLAAQARQQIVLVTISDETFRHLPGPPVPRDYQAKVIRELTAAGAKVIAFDLVFDLPTPKDPAMVAAARASKNVLWACLFEGDDTQRRKIQPIAPFLGASPNEGHILVPQDPDMMTVDSLEPVIDYHGHLVPAFSLQAARMALGLEAKPIQAAPGGWRVGGLEIPTDARNRFRINYLGRSGQVFTVIPYEDVYNGIAKDPFYRDNGIFKNKIVLVGDTTTVGDDHRFTPLGDMAGLEIHAEALATFLQRGFINDLSPTSNALAIALLAAIALIPLTLLPLRASFLGSLVLGVAYFGFDVWLFAAHRISLHLVAPEVALLLLSAGGLAERSLSEEREKTRMQGLLQRYVSPQVASYVIENPEKCILGGGEQVTASVLFCDIRGFTAHAEEMTAGEMVERLNEYFQAMTDVIFAHEGTVDKFMGDAVMAIFGAPVPHADHARRAVAAALDMQEALLKLQAGWSERGLPAFEIGIGVGTGPMVVGNIGARERLDFTAIGDTVNLACRIEELTKELECRILVTEDTFRLVEKQVRARGPLVASIPGRKGTATVYEVLAWQETEIDWLSTGGGAGRGHGQKEGS